MGKKTQMTVDKKGLALLQTDQDIRTQIKQSSDANETHFRYLWEISSDAMALSDPDGIVLDANPAYLLLCGYTAEQVIGQSFTLILPEERRAGALQQYKELFASNSPPSAFETVVLCADGSNRHAVLRTSFLTTAGQRTAILSVINDITNNTLHKQAQLAELHRGLIQGQEEERGHLARELHDGPLQELVGLGFELTALRYSLADEHQQTHLAALVARLEQTGRHLRHIAMTLRPPVLIFGLFPAIRQCVEEYRHRQPAQIVELTLDGEAAARPEAITLALYRICGQSLVNIARHAAATHVWVRLQAASTQIVLEIEDNGRGFVVPTYWTEFTRQHHLGVAGMSERANALGGRLVVYSEPGQGTRVRVTVPLPQP